MAGITDSDDYSKIFNAIIRLLSNASKSQQVVLPYSVKVLGSHQESLLLFWHLLDTNRAFA